MTKLRIFWQAAKKFSLNFRLVFYADTAGEAATTPVTPAVCLFFCRFIRIGRDVWFSPDCIIRRDRLRYRPQVLRDRLSDSPVSGRCT